jgi:hypothetical protein
VRHDRGESKTVTDARPGRASVVLSLEAAVYLVLYMPALRTQVYLSEEQRRRLDLLRRARGDSLAELIRAAVDDYLDREGLEVGDALELTFGAAPEAEAALRDEWSEGQARAGRG